MKNLEQLMQDEVELFEAALNIIESEDNYEKTEVEEFFKVSHHDIAFSRVALMY